MKSRIPPLRIRTMNRAEVQKDRAFVLYWMTAFRRPTWNYALDRAVEWSRELNRPLVVLEAVRCDYQWASDRFHQYIVSTMEANQRSFEKTDITHYPYVEPEIGAGKGLLEELAGNACVVIADDFPAFFLPRMVSAAAKALDVRLEAVDSNGILPMAEPEKVFPTAHSFRRHLQAVLRDHLGERPKTRLPNQGSLPKSKPVPASILRRWAPASAKMLEASPSSFASLPIDHQVTAVPESRGSEAARHQWREFLWEKLDHYDQDRNLPEQEGSSGISAALHFGTLSSHQVVTELFDREDWNESRLAKTKDGKREGWWGMSKAAEAFLDQVITWREVGYNFCSHRTDYDRYSSLPDWARQTLREHEGDPRASVYSLEQFETSKTHDPLWNAAQRQLVLEGRMHNYLRMLWGKKILEWSKTPKQALKVMIELNNKYALDGRNPNSYSGIFWILGRYDRAWGPERPIFGKIRYMSSDNTARKFPTKQYVQRYSAQQPMLW